MAQQLKDDCKKEAPSVGREAAIVIKKQVLVGKYSNIGR